ncbi:hypothetical protein ACFU5Y_25545 [Streptomyces gardneri]|uniref:hypothetical protein n=1 Tax=Streptomyces gardneri TaxID=66892 RepID=UPI0036BB6F33
MSWRRSAGAVSRIAERGETAVVSPATPGQPANLAALHACSTAHVLHTAPGSVSVPVDIHETVSTVAGLLAEQPGSRSRCRGCCHLLKHADPPRTLCPSCTRLLLRL